MKIPGDTEAIKVLREDVTRKDKEAAATERTMTEVAAAQLKKLEAAQAALDERRQVVGRLKGEYDAIATTGMVEERRRLEETNTTEDDLKTGKVTAAAFMEKHLDPAQIEARAAAITQEKLAPIAKAIRSARMDALKAEGAVVEAEFEIAFCKSAPLQSRLEAEKARLKEADAAAGIALGGLAGAMTRRQTVLRRLGIATGGGAPHLGGEQLYDLDLAALEGLKFDPVITDEMLPELDKLADQVRAGGAGAKLKVLTIRHDGRFGTVRVE